MAQPYGSKQAASVLIDPMNEPEPSEETGLNASVGSTFAPAKEINGSTSPSSSRNPYRNSPAETPLNKGGASSAVRSSGGSPREPFPNYRSEAFNNHETTSRRRAGSHGTPPSYNEVTTGGSSEPKGRRRGSSLRERYPGDKSTQPLNVIRRDSRKAHRSPHLNKRSMPGADMVDRLDPAIGGRAYHHEGPYDAALMSRNRDPKTAPLGAIQSSNEEALKATPRENIKDAVERHKPLDGTAFVPPGHQDRMGRTYNYEEGADLMHESSSGDAGYKRWPGKDYDPEDLKGESEPMFTLDRSLRAHKIDDNGIEMEDRAQLTRDYKDQERDGTLDQRDPVHIAGDDGKYADMEFANSKDTDAGHKHSGSMGGLKQKIGSLRHRKHRES
ncbi:hypothetical protein LTR37_012809 [Vermiconidia calcicola]|uniref:Uncharacterized protein n=1 Tax=Vermiconidia calcicola TaxID=1690605 RepID=A0ACC3MY62_9PEZI|nr:hypothetical protein LTR37_012809 [Vermiconidia calcicola]